MELARPAHCPGCGAASRPLGRGLVLHGHGLRARTTFARGVHRAEITEVLARRYVCCACGAVVLVVPAEVARRHLYTLCVIAGALAAWSHGVLPARAVRAEYGAFPIMGAAARGWHIACALDTRSQPTVATATTTAGREPAAGCARAMREAQRVRAAADGPCP